MARPQVMLQPRAITGKKVKQLRRQGIAPASICGKGVENQNVQINMREFDMVYRQVGRTALVDLQLPNTRAVPSAFVRQVQRNPLTGQLIHVDFRVVDLRVEITADVPVVIVGENELVKREQAVAVLGQPTLSVHALPTELPQVIEVDISGLEDFTTTIHVGDLHLPGNVQILTPAEEAVVTLSPSTTQEDEAHLQEEEQFGEVVEEDTTPESLENTEDE